MSHTGPPFHDIAPELRLAKQGSVRKIKNVLSMKIQSDGRC